MAADSPAVPPEETPEQRQRRTAEVERIIRQRETSIQREAERREHREREQKETEKRQTAGALAEVAEVDRKREAFAEWRADRKEQKKQRERERLAAEKERQRQAHLQALAAEKKEKDKEYMHQIRRTAAQKRLAADKKHSAHEEQVEVEHAKNHRFIAEQSARTRLNSDLTRIEQARQRDLSASRETASIATRQLATRTSTHKREIQGKFHAAEEAAKRLPVAQQSGAVAKARNEEAAALRALEGEKRAEEARIAAQQQQRDAAIEQAARQQTEAARRAYDAAMEAAAASEQREMADAAQRREESDKQSSIRAASASR